MTSCSDASSWTNSLSIGRSFQVNSFVLECFVLDELHDRWEIALHEWLCAQMLSVLDEFSQHWEFVLSECLRAQTLCPRQIP
jgi:hypothetical protein